MLGVRVGLMSLLLEFIGQSSSVSQLVTLQPLIDRMFSSISAEWVRMVMVTRPRRGRDKSQTK